MLKKHYKFVRPLFKDSSFHAPKSCEHLGCNKIGSFKAPKNALLQDYHFFCHDHVKEYNASWNYFKNMTHADIARYNNEEASGHRPSWPFGLPGRNPFRFQDIHDPFNLYSAKKSPQDPHLPKAVRQAMSNLDLDSPLNQSTLKTRYKTLAKTCHPDLHQNSKKAEERFKRITADYDTLKKYILNKKT